MRVELLCADQKAGLRRCTHGDACLDDDRVAVMIAPTAEEAADRKARTALVVNGINEVLAAYEVLLQSPPLEESGGKEEIEDQIKRLDRQVDSLKDQTEKLKMLMAAVDKLMPAFRDMMTSDGGCGQS